MKATLLAVGLILGLIGGASAARFTDMGAAWQLVDEMRDLMGMRSLVGADVQKVTCTAETTQGPKVISFAPGDQGWNGLLSTLNTMVNNRIAAIKTQLQALQVTEVPE